MEGELLHKMKLNVFWTIQISCRHFTSLKTKEQRNRVERKEGTMVGRANRVPAGVGTAVSCPTLLVRPIQQQTWVLKGHRRDNWVVDSGKKQPAMAEKMFCTKNEVIFTTFYSILLVKDAEVTYLCCFKAFKYLGCPFTLDLSGVPFLLNPQGSVLWYPCCIWGCAGRWGLLEAALTRVINEPLFAVAWACATKTHLWESCSGFVTLLWLQLGNYYS